MTDKFIKALRNVLRYCEIYVYEEYDDDLPQSEFAESMQILQEVAHTDYKKEGDVKVKMNKNGRSTTITPGTFACEKYFSPLFKRDLVQWDYRDRAGRLYSGIAESVDKAKEAARKQSGEAIE